MARGAARRRKAIAEAANANEILHPGYRHVRSTGDVMPSAAHSTRTIGGHSPPSAVPGFALLFSVALKDSPGRAARHLSAPPRRGRGAGSRVAVPGGGAPTALASRANCDRDGGGYGANPRRRRRSSIHACGGRCALGNLAAWTSPGIRCRTMDCVARRRRAGRPADQGLAGAGTGEPRTRGISS